MISLGCADREQTLADQTLVPSYFIFYVAAWVKEHKPGLITPVLNTTLSTLLVSPHTLLSFKHDGVLASVSKVLLNHPGHQSLNLMFHIHPILPSINWFIHFFLSLPSTSLSLISSQCRLDQRKSLLVSLKSSQNTVAYRWTCSGSHLDLPTPSLPFSPPPLCH